MNQTYEFPGLKIIKLGLIGGFIMFSIIIAILSTIGFKGNMLYLFVAVWLSMGIMDFVAYNVIKAIKTKPIKILAAGIPLETKFLRVEEAYFSNKARQKGFAIVAVSSDGKEYVSHTLSFDPAPYVTEKLAVYYNANNPKEYFMDTRPVFYAKGIKPVLY